VFDVVVDDDVSVSVVVVVTNVVVVVADDDVAVSDSSPRPQFRCRRKGQTFIEAGHREGPSLAQSSDRGQEDDDDLRRRKGSGLQPQADD